MSAKTLPPKWSLRLIRTLCHEQLVEEIEGNLIEYYATLCAQQKRFLSLRFAYEVLNYIRPSTLKNPFMKLQSGSSFIFNPFQSLRMLSRHGISAVINVSGFTLGLVCIIFLYFHIKGELGYDNFHMDKDKIYRVLRIGSINETKYDIGVTSGPFAPALLQDFENTIYDACRVQFPFGENSLITFDDKRFMDDRVVFADPNFFRFFTFPLVSGDPKTVLANPNQVVISQAVANKYFPNENPLGKTLYVDIDDAFVVSGVFKNLDNKRSHLQFDIVTSIEIFNTSQWFHRWWNNSLVTYVKIASPGEAAGVEQQFTAFMDKYFGNDFERTGSRIDLKLEPLTDTYFNHQTRYDPVIHGNFQTLQILGIVGIAILLIASFNYVNLAIAFSFQRSKEVGIKKVLGAPRERLIVQFIGESLFILLFSFGAAILLGELLRPVSNRIFDLDVIYQWSDFQVMTFFGGLLLTLLILSCVYPAAFISGFAPLKVLNVSNLPVGKNIQLRKTLVVLQFAISIFMIAATLLILIQMQFIQGKDLGFDREAIVIVSNYNSDIRTNAENFKHEVLSSPYIRNVTTSSGEPGGFHDATVFEVPGVEELVRMRTLFADPNYLRTYGVEIVAGRDFSENLESDQNTMIVNESGLNEIGIHVDELLGSTVTLPSFDVRGKVIGIAKDFHFSSLHDDIEPLVIIMANRHHAKYSISLHPESIRKGMQYIDETWSKYSPVYPIKYNFLDDSLGRLYENEIKQSKVFTAFAGISIFLACFGLFGLVCYAAQRRQKELSIRKVLGADIVHIVRLLSREYLLILLIALVLSIPPALWFINTWLSGFAYRIALIDFWYVFVVSGAVTILLAFATISIRTWRTAYSNPLQSIRYE